MLFKHTTAQREQQSYAENLLHRESFAQRSFYAQRTFTERICCADSLHIKKSFSKHNLLHREAFHTEQAYTEKLLHRAQRSFYTEQADREKLLHGEAFPQSKLSHSKLIHREAFTKRSFYTEKLLQTASLHREPLTRISFYTEQAFTQSRLRQREAFTQRKRLQRKAFTQRSFYAEQAFTQSKLLHRASFDREKLSHREVFYMEQACTEPERSFYKEQAFTDRRLSQREAFTQSKFLQGEAFTQSKLLHREAFTQSKLLQGEAFAQSKLRQREAFTRSKLLQRASLHRVREKLLHREAFTESKLLQREGFTQQHKLQLQNRISTPRPKRKKRRFRGILLKIGRKIISAKKSKNCYQTLSCNRIVLRMQLQQRRTLTQPLHCDSLRPQLQNTIELRVPATQIAAPKPDFHTKAEKRFGVGAFCTRNVKSKINSTNIAKNLVPKHHSQPCCSNFNTIRFTILSCKRQYDHARSRSSEEPAYSHHTAICRDGVAKHNSTAAQRQQEETTNHLRPQFKCGHRSSMIPR